MNTRITQKDYVQILYISAVNQEIQCVLTKHAISGGGNSVFWEIGSA